MKFIMIKQFNRPKKPKISSIDVLGFFYILEKLFNLPNI